MGVSSVRHVLGFSVWTGGHVVGHIVNANVLSGHARRDKARLNHNTERLKMHYSVGCVFFTINAYDVCETCVS